MKIKDSEITLSSSRTFRENTTVKTAYQMEWITILNDKFQDRLNSAKPLIAGMPSTSLSNGLDSADVIGNLSLMNEMTTAIQTESGNGLTRMNGIVQSLLELMIQKMISMEFLIGEFTDFKYDFQYFSLGVKNPMAQEPSFELQYKLYEEKIISHNEREHTSFFSEGVVQTEAGKKVDFVMNFDMKREYLNQTKMSFTEEGQIQLIDPLVLTFDGSMPELSDFKFSFDLDFNGETEELISFKAGSGFLAFDRNKDGLINDGRELFGPSSGSGFEELALHDSDQNHWIDENDAIFNELSVWNPDPKGNGQISSLKDQGIGAIYLDRAETEFDIRDMDTNSLACRIRDTGLFLNEDGTPGAIQELDLNSNSQEKIS